MPESGSADWLRETATDCAGLLRRPGGIQADPGRVFQAGKEGFDGFDHGKVSANFLSLEAFEPDFNKRLRTGTAQNVAFVKLNGAGYK
jgi:hypothetical protein